MNRPKAYALNGVLKNLITNQAWPKMIDCHKLLCITTTHIVDVTKNNKNNNLSS